MCQHQSVEFRALQTKLPSSSRFRDSDHTQEFKPLLNDHGRSCLAHAPTKVLTTTPWSGSDLQPSIRLGVSQKDHQHGQRKTDLVVLSWVPTQFVPRYTGTVESNSICYVPHARFGDVCLVLFHVFCFLVLLSFFTQPQPTPTTLWYKYDYDC